MYLIYFFSLFGPFSVFNLILPVDDVIKINEKYGHFRPTFFKDEVYLLILMKIIAYFGKKLARIFLIAFKNGENTFTKIYGVSTKYRYKSSYRIGCGLSEKLVLN